MVCCASVRKNDAKFDILSRDCDTRILYSELLRLRSRRWSGNSAEDADFELFSSLSKFFELLEWRFSVETERESDIRQCRETTLDQEIIMIGYIEGKSMEIEQNSNIAVHMRNQSAQKEFNAHALQELTLWGAKAREN